MRVIRKQYGKKGIGALIYTLKLSKNDIEILEADIGLSFTVEAKGWDYVNVDVRKAMRKAREGEGKNE